MYKLRSMYTDRADRIKVVTVAEAQGQVYKSNSDPRVTPVGWLIRKSSVDELPQRPGT